MKKIVFLTCLIMANSAVAQTEKPDFSEVKQTYIASCSDTANKISQYTLNQEFVQQSCECTFEQVLSLYPDESTFIDEMIRVEKAIVTGQVEDSHNEFLRNTHNAGMQCAMKTIAQRNSLNK